MLELLLIGGGYLFGSISSAIITCRVLGLPDPRSQGSGNPGATNVLRTGRKDLALATLLLDSGKGAIAALVVTFLTDDANAGLAAGFFAAFFLKSFYQLGYKDLVAGN